MELRQYYLLLRKWLWLVVICTLAAGVTAYVVSKRSMPIYQASATLMVNQASTPAMTAGYTDILSSERLARTYANLLTGWPVIEGTAKRLGLATDSTAIERLQKTISVTPVRDTQLLEVKVEGPNPELIAAIANTLPEIFIAQAQQLKTTRVSESRQNLERELANVEADIARTQDVLKAATDDGQRLRLETSLAQYRSTYSSLVASYQQVRLAEAQASDNVVIAEAAQVPTKPIRPRTSTNTLLAAIVGAMLAIGAAFLVEYLDDTIKTPDDVRRTSGLSTLGAIARLKEVGGERQLIAWQHKRAPESEAYRTLRTNIQFSSVDKPVRTLLVTSSGPSEGKSTTAANLAVVMAQTGQRVVLVDTDLRRPVVHKIFGVPNGAGLTSALLAGNGDLLDGHLQPTSVENLSVLTSGPIPPNPSELLGSHRMANLVQALSEHADMVIFDSPPVLAVTDAAVLGRQLDGVMLVADAGQTREQFLAQASAELQKTGANVLGVALNRLDSRSGGYYYYYYYYSEDGSPRRRSGSGDEGRADNGKANIRWPWRRRTES